MTPGQPEMIPVLRHPCREDQRSTDLLVLLPGAEIKLEDFATQGFISAARTQGLEHDILCAGLNYEHVMARTVESTLHENVILPARAAGYRKIHLAGISLGAFNALLYASAHPAEAASLTLLSPYPGTGDILAELRKAGGPQAWLDTPEAQQGDERVFWRWLAACQRSGSWPCPIHAFTGTEDRFLRGQRMLMEMLPAGCAHELPGQHDWPAWQAQWAYALQHALAGCAPCERNPSPSGGSALHSRSAPEAQGWALRTPSSAPLTGEGVQSPGRTVCSSPVKGRSGGVSSAKKVRPTHSPEGES